MSDALLSTPVALSAGVVAAGLLAVAGAKVKKNENPTLVPLMGVMGAFVFAAQMINFSIPGTGSSGHIVGGVLLAALLGPWAAFITLASVLIIQCLIFSDGGLLALGCNIINMGAMSALVAYPLIFKPIVGKSANPWRVALGSVAACVIGLELGACLVTGETELSGITALGTGKFMALMAGIHLPIGIGEGLATAAILAFVARTRPDLLHGRTSLPQKKSVRKAVVAFAVAALVVGGGLVWFASSNPDGLEWSVARTTGQEELKPEHETTISQGAAKITKATAVIPDYESPLSGIIGAVLVLMVVWGITAALVRKPHALPQESDNV